MKAEEDAPTYAVFARDRTEGGAELFPAQWSYEVAELDEQGIYHAIADVHHRVDAVTIRDRLNEGRGV
jgi:hypothetical protein